MKQKSRFDQQVSGLVPGLVVPVVTLIITWMIVSEQGLADYIEAARKINRFSSIISLSVLPNLLIFFVFIWMDMYRAARGVIFATLILAFVMLIFKFM